MTTAIASDALLDRLFAAEEFPPAEGRELLDSLRDEVLELRQAAFVALMLRLAAAPGDVARNAGVALEAFMALGREQRLAVVGEPAFVIWLQRSARLERGAEASVAGELDELLSSFPDVLARSVERASSDGLGLETPVAVNRYDVDPLVATAAPPTYTFPPPERARELEEQTSYSLAVFTSVARAALFRIGSAWPELRGLFPRYVRTVVHLPFGKFRSASASRYAGVIFLTADDRTIFEVEESLVHEWSHQVLYSVMELDPIVVDGGRGELALPWSGARRDFYGYFHALFVYTLLLRYLERIEGRSSTEMERVCELYDHILRGAVRALPDFDDDSRFTEHGRELRRILRNVTERRPAASRHGLRGGDAYEHAGGDRG